MLSYVLGARVAIMLFDTDVMVWFFRGNEKAVQFFEREPRRFISQVTWMELVQGAQNKRELTRIKTLLPSINVEILPLTESIGNRGVMYLEQHAMKDGLMLADALVGATALVHGVPLATANVKHFIHLSGLSLSVFKP